MFRKVSIWAADDSEFKKSAAAQMDTFLNIVYAMLALR